MPRLLAVTQKLCIILNSLKTVFLQVPHSASVIPAHIATFALWSHAVLKERRLNTALMSQHTGFDGRDSQSGKWVDNIDAADVLGRES